MVSKIFYIWVCACSLPYIQEALSEPPLTVEVTRRYLFKYERCVFTRFHLAIIHTNPKATILNVVILVRNHDEGF